MMTADEQTARTRPRWLVEIVIVVGLLVVYDRLVDLAGGRIDDANARGQGLLSLERVFHLDVERAFDAVVAASHPLTVLLSAYYNVAHVSVTLAVLALVLWRAPDDYRRLRNALVLTNLLAFGVFVALPTAPPRLLPDAGIVDVVARSHVWFSWESNQAIAAHAMQYASIPSLHLAWALWCLLAARVLTRRPALRWLAAVHVAVTAVVVVGTGNHYLVDVVAGLLLAVLAWRVSAPRLVVTQPRPEVLIVSASMGAGHDGVAYELARRLRGAGRTVEVVDYLTLMPLHIGWVLKVVYGAQLRRAPRTYEWLYSVLDHHGPLLRIAHVIASFARPALLRVAHGTGLVVATYPLGGRVLGSLRRSGRLRTTAVTFLTDPDVHELWLDSGTDLYLAAYPGSAQETAERTGRPVHSCGPVVSPRFAEPVTAAERAVARAALGVDGERVALLTTGSWGVGDAAETARAVAASGALPVVLCGRNEALLRELQDAPGVRALGWTSDVRPLYAAADLVVHNAGGLASIEGFAAGVPVVGHACLPGHGHRNARVMAAAGIAAYAADRAELLDLVDRLAGTEDGRALASRAREIFVGDPAPMLERLALAGVAEQRSTAPGRARAGWRRATWAQRAAAVGAAVPLLFSGLSYGVSEATTRGFGTTAHVPAPDRGVVYVAALLDSRQVTSADARAVGAGSISIVVTPEVARNDRTALRRLESAGIEVFGTAPLHLPQGPSAATRAFATAAATIADATGRQSPAIVCLHGLGPFALAEARSSHAAFAVARATATPDRLPRLAGGSVLVVDLRGLRPDQLPAALAAIGARAAKERLRVKGLRLTTTRTTS